jgi:hypothetical protein
MSKLVPRQIYLDIVEWEQLGEKIGKNARSQWIREQIHEMVKLPDEKAAIEQRLEETDLTRQKLKEKLSVIQQREQREFEELGNKSDRMDKAIREAEKLISKQKTINRETMDKVPMIGQDQIKEISENFKVDADDLLDILRAYEELEILKYGNAGTHDTKDSVYSVGR